MAKMLFWGSLLIILWIYIGYPFSLFLCAKICGEDPELDEERYEPTISIIIAAYNEEEVIKERIQNCLALDYPRDKMEIIVGSDGSQDKTVQIVKEFRDPRIKALEFTLNRGRSQVHNDCVKHARGEIIFFTDADTRYNPSCVRHMVKHYANSQVGCVGGGIVSVRDDEKSLGDGHNFYWQVEYMSRKAQSKLGILTKVSGANLSIRRKLYQPISPLMDIDQVVGPVTLLQGYRVIHEPKAIVYDSFPVSLSNELSARQRFTVRALTALIHNRVLLNPLKYPLVSVNSIFYRLGRYLIPFFAIVLFVSSLFLLYTPFGRLAFIGQLIVLSMALVGYALETISEQVRVFSLPFSFFWMNLGIFLGVLRFLVGKRITSYTPIRERRTSTQESGSH